MKVAFGISVGSSTPLLRREDTRKFMDLVKMADDYGAEAIGTFDTAFIGGDAYVRATLIAQASARARVGLRPTNPLTREPQVMASFLASIDHLTDGRAFMDMASGDSAVLNIGYRAASRARIEEYVTCVRDLLAKGQATYQGRPQRVRWSSSAARARVRRDWIGRIQQVGALAGTRLWIGVSGHDLDTQAHYLGILGSQIMPRFIA